MWSRSLNGHVLAALAGAVALAALVLSSSALALSSPSVTVSPSSPSAANDWTFTFSATPDPGATITGYEGGVVSSPGDEPAGAIGSPFTDSGRAEGTWYFRVRAVQVDALSQETRTGYATKAFTIDRTAPAPPVPRLDPPRPNGTHGWWKGPLTIRWSCSDPSGASCPDQPIVAAKKGMIARQRATDGAGNVSAEAATAPFDFDNGASQPAISSPSNGALVAGEPTYKWTRITDPTSGNNRFEVWARWGGGSYQQIAYAPGGATQSTRNVRAAPLPEGVVVTWFVRFYDNAGNFRDAATRTFKIDPTPPSAAPVITGGPAGPTRQAAPTFTWTGDQPGFAWAVTRDGDAAPAQSGRASGKQVTLAALADGDYAFSVSQVTALDAVGPEASQSFTVDTVRPAPPVITARPAAPTTMPASFAWTTESGALSRWQVLDASGAVVKGPADAIDPVVNIGALAPGAYTFSVAQADAAGNVSDPTAESFSVQSPSGTTVAATPPRIALPKQNAGRLSPRAGRRIATLRPVFRWQKGPAGTTLYNLQLFRVVTRRPGEAPAIRKILSVFPRGLRYRLRSRVVPGQCYVWRVWPYTGTSFTPKPLGISNFCVVSAKALKRSKARLRARHQAAASRVG